MWLSDVRTGKSAGIPCFEELLRTSHLRARLQTLISSSASLLYRFHYVLNSEHFIIFILLCNSRTHIITPYFRQCM
jgi:hypothetical protein